MTGLKYTTHRFTTYVVNTERVYIGRSHVWMAILQTKQTELHPYILGSQRQCISLPLQMNHIHINNILKIPHPRVGKQRKILSTSL